MIKILAYNCWWCQVAAPVVLCTRVCFVCVCVKFVCVHIFVSVHVHSLMWSNKILYMVPCLCSVCWSALNQCAVCLCIVCRSALNQCAVCLCSVCRSALNQCAWKRKAHATVKQIGPCKNDMEGDCGIRLAVMQAFWLRVAAILLLNPKPVTNIFSQECYFQCKHFESCPSEGTTQGMSIEATLVK